MCCRHSHASVCCSLHTCSFPTYSRAGTTGWPRIRLRTTSRPQSPGNSFDGRWPAPVPPRPGACFQACSCAPLLRPPAPVCLQGAMLGRTLATIWGRGLGDLGVCAASLTPKQTCCGAAAVPRLMSRKGGRLLCLRGHAALGVQRQHAEQSLLRGLAAASALPRSCCPLTPGCYPKLAEGGCSCQLVLSCGPGMCPTRPQQSCVVWGWTLDLGPAVWLHLHRHPHSSGVGRQGSSPTWLHALPVLHIS